MPSDSCLRPGDGYGGAGVHYFPPCADFTLLFLHGRGDSGEGWAELLHLLNSRPALKNRFRLILPTADEIYITKYKFRCNAWFDSRSERRDVDEDREGFHRSCDRMEEIMKKEIQENNIKPQNIILAGFSQGGAMAYYIPLHSQLQLGGAICLSGWCPFLHDLEQQQQQQQQQETSSSSSRSSSSAFVTGSFPFLHLHGTADDVVEYNFARATFDRAVAAATKAAAAATAAATAAAAAANENPKKRFVFKTYEGLAHQSNAAEMDDFLDFLEECVKRKG
ncbi:hypothetical protein, conserved [Eimeria brunetti]|uniref:Phospholipase/carboxylesterase/thioesterase domain-containing protein n=1 Tax=Eimeria brunetti TaxID=51314 RepID=U6LSY7_9EIME|nr:hypothetical protein, conserved [Eimeria brunetti]